MSGEDESEEKENSNSGQWDQTLVLALGVDDEEDNDTGQHGKAEAQGNVPEMFALHFFRQIQIHFVFKCIVISVFSH